MAYDIGPKIGIEGEKEWRDQIKTLNNSLKTLGTEMAVATSSFDKGDRSMDALSAQSAVLTKQIEAQRAKVEAANKALWSAAEQYDINDERVQIWQRTVNTATAQLNNMERELGKNQSEMEALSKDADAAGEKVEDFGIQAQTAEKKASSFRANIAKLGSGMAKVGVAVGKAATAGVVALGAAAAGAAVGIWNMANNAADNADEVQRMADVTGMSAERIQELQYAGNNLGVELTTITGAQAKLTKTMAAAATGKGGPNAQAKAFKALGISARDSSGNLRDSQTVMNEAITALSGMSNETERDALAMQLFGKSAMELNPLIKAGGDELARLTEEAHKNGAVLSGEQIAALDAFGDAVGNLKASAQGLGGTLASALLPQLNNLVALAQELAVAVGGAVKSGDWSKVGAIIATGLQGIVEQLTAFMPQLLNIATTILTTLVTSITKSLPTLLPQLTTALLSLVTAMVGVLSSQGPTLVTAAIAAIGQLAMGMLQALPQITQAAIDIILALVQGISAQLPTLIPAAVDAILTLVQTLVDNLPMLIDAAIQLILALVDGLIKALPEIIAAAPKIITSLVNGLVKALPQLVDAALQIIVALGKALVENYPLMVKAAIEIIGALVGGLLNALGQINTVGPKIFEKLRDALGSLDWKKLGKNMIDGIIEGIKNGAKAIASAAKSAAQTALDAAKRLLGINSPSRVMRDQVGKQIAAGMAQGITRNTGMVDRAMAALNDRLNIGAMRLTPSLALAGAAGASSTANTYNITVSVPGNFSVRSQADIDAIGQGIARAAENKLRALGIGRLR